MLANEEYSAYQDHFSPISKMFLVLNSWHAIW